MSKVANFAKNLEYLLQKRGKKREVAAASGWSEVFIYQVIQRKREPSLEKALDMADALEVDLVEMCRLPSVFKESHPLDAPNGRKKDSRFDVSGD